MLKKLGILLLLIYLSFVSVKVLQNTKSTNLHLIAYANHDEPEEDEHEDEEDEHEEEDEDEHEDYEEYEQTEYVEYTVYSGSEVPTNTLITEVPVTTYVTVVDSGYDIDTDGDGLVDAIDPHPSTPEVLLYTDSDNDSVPDANDAYPDEDDFLYIMFEDVNENGILDFLES